MTTAAPSGNRAPGPLDQAAGPGTAPRRVPLLRFAAAAAVLSLAVGGLLYWPTFRCAWAYDDMDYLNYAARVLAGGDGYWTSVFHPHLEHLAPLVRIAFHASVARFGVWALPFRLLVFLAHAGAAFFMALVARRYTGSSAGGMTAALAYLLPAGFSSHWVWVPNGAGVPFGLFGATGALAALAWTGSLGRARARGLAAAGLLLTAAAESTLVPLFLVAMLLDEIERRRGPGAGGDPADAPAAAPARRRLVGGFSIAVAATAAAAMAAAAILYRRTYGHGFVLDPVRGLPRTLFLVMVAPFRYFFPNVPLAPRGAPPFWLPIAGCLLGLVVAAVGAAVLLGLGRRFPAGLVPVTAAAASGPLVILLLVGLGRFDSPYDDLYDADRYFFTLLLPICLVLAGVAAGVAAVAGTWSQRRRRALALALASAVAAEAVLHFAALRARVPFATYAQHEHRFAELGLLASALARAARQVPRGQPRLRFPDSDLHFPDVHNGRVSAALLLFGAGRGKTGVELAAGPVGERDERVFNPVLRRWAETAGEPLPFLSIAGGRLLDAHYQVMADFRRDAGEAMVVSGFYAWQNASRWMMRRGVLRLTADGPWIVLRVGAPAREIAHRHPERPPLSVNVSVTDRATGINIPIGKVAIGPGDDDGLHALDGGAFLRTFGAGRSVLLVLEAGPPWRPSDVLPPALDDRLLTVRVAAAGFAAGP
jgi:hypothetical protein